MRAERSARVFRHRNKPRYTQIAIIRRFCKKLSDISPVRDISTFKRSFQCIMLAESSARVFRRRNMPRYTQTAIIRRFRRKLSDISLPFEIFRRLNAFALRYACRTYYTPVLQRGNKPRYT